MGILDIPRRGKKRHRNSNSRGGEGSNYSKKSQGLISPTHQPLQLLTAELAQKDISPGHSQFFQPAGNWTQPTDQKGAMGLRVMERFMMTITTLVRCRKSPIPIHLPLLGYHLRSPGMLLLIPPPNPAFPISAIPLFISLFLFPQFP